MPPPSIHSITARRAVGGQSADIGHHDDRRSLLDQFWDGFGKIEAGGRDDVGIGLECPVDVVERGKQRLRLVAFGLRDQRDAAAPLALVQNPRRAGVKLAIDGQRGEIVLRSSKGTRISPRASLSPDARIPSTASARRRPRSS